MNFTVTLPFLSCLVTAFLALLLSRHNTLQKTVHVLGSLSYLLFVVNLYWDIHQYGTLIFNFGGYPAGIAISFRVDYFSALMLLVSSLIVFAVSIYSLIDSTIKSHSSFFPAFWFLICGVTGVFSTGDLFNLYIWFELMVIASFVMMTHASGKDLLQGSLYYVAINLLATLILLLAISFLYGFSGTLDMERMATWAQLKTHLPFVQVCFMLLMVAFAIKSALFPYYFWLPDSYPLTSVSSSGLFAGLLTKVGVYALIRAGTLFLLHDVQFMQILLFVSCLTMLGGVFGAMGDFHIRRILSFHIISQVGYMTLGLAMRSTLAITAALFYIVHHILVKTNLFLISGLMTRYSGQVDLRQMGGFFRLKPALVVLFFITAFSLAGLPPLSGFWAKYLMIRSAFASSFWVPGAIALVVGFFTLFSMIKIWQYVFLQPSNHDVRAVKGVERTLLYIPIVFLALLTLFIGLYPELLYQSAERAVQSLLRPNEISVDYKER